MLRKARRLVRRFVERCYNACFNPPCGYVLMLHRIGPPEPDRLGVIEGLKVSEAWLQRYVDSKKVRYDFISLDDLFQRLSVKAFKQRPFICITFDDGFKDNLSIGLPFFEKNKIPFSVFLSTGFIDKKPEFNYPFLLERMVRENDVLVVDGKEYVCLTRAQKNQVFCSLKEKVLHLPYDSFETSFRTLFKEYLKSEHFEDLMMSWDDARELASSSLCTIGSHTVTHCRLSNLSDQELEMELTGSKKRIESEIGKEVCYISYPYGWKTDVNDKVIGCTQKAGYKLGFISYGGPIRRQGLDLFRVKRLMLEDNSE